MPFPIKDLERKLALIMLVPCDMFLESKVYRCTAMIEQDGAMIPGRNYTWISNMRMLGVDGFIGQKKGWTPPAGHCIALEYKKDGHHFSIVTINSKTKNTLWTEVQQLVSWAIWREK